MRVLSKYLYCIVINVKCVWLSILHGNSASGPWGERAAGTGHQLGLAIWLSVEGISSLPPPPERAINWKFAQSARSYVTTAGAWAPFQTFNYFSLFD